VRLTNACYCLTLRILSLKVDQPEEEVESENVLSDLVNYIQPVHFKSFEYAESK
jgi:hypothetical protein